VTSPRRGQRNLSGTEDRGVMYRIASRFGLLMLRSPQHRELNPQA
jgi:hypothetical protein